MGETGMGDVGIGEVGIGEVGRMAADLIDSRSFVNGVPHDLFARLRRDAPVCWVDEPAGPAGPGGQQPGPGFWAVTRYDDCVAVNRDYEHFSSHLQATFIWETPEPELSQQQLMMLNMDPPLHTRYRRLVNKGFTPRMVQRLEAHIHQVADDIIDSVCEQGRADFVTDMVAELPLVVIAELLGVPQADRHLVFDWSNQMVGSQDPEYQLSADRAGQAAMELYAYASQLFATKRGDPHEDLMSALTQVSVDGEQLSGLELELFFLLLSVAGNETTRNLMAGGMQAFFDHPDEWQRLRADRSLLPGAVEEMLRYVTPVMNFRRQTTAPVTIGGQAVGADEKVVFFHTSANRDERVFAEPDRFDVGREPNPHIAFGGGGPHFCLGANLARMEIRVMWEHLLDRLPDLAAAGPAQRLQSQFINGIKHLPVSFTPAPRRRGAVGAAV